MPAYLNTAVEVIDLPDFTKIPDKLPKAIDSMSLAHALGVRNKTLMHQVVHRDNAYTVHRIPKKSGGLRVIHAPNERMKYVQARVLDTLFSNLDYPEHIAAYVKGKTTRDSAALHAGKPILIVLDLKDFFPSTRRAWIRSMLHQQFGYSHAVAGVLADLMTVSVDTPNGKRYVVPQGAPTSGAVCNWVAHYRIDEKILEVCNRWGMTYTRYADDLAFSHNERLPKAKTNAFLREIGKIIKDSGYTINRKKLRIVRSGRQQRLLGMTVNEKPNIMRLQYRKMRARIHNCKTKGLAVVASEMGINNPLKLKSQIEGQLSYWNMINPIKAAKLKLQFEHACGSPDPVERPV